MNLACNPLQARGKAKGCSSAYPGQSLSAPAAVKRDTRSAGARVVGRSKLATAILHHPSLDVFQGVTCIRRNRCAFCTGLTEPGLAQHVEVTRI